MSDLNPDVLPYLSDVHFHADCVVFGAETWSDQYRKNRKTFKKIVKTQATMARNMRSYFSGLRERVDRLIRWPEYQQRIVKGAEDDLIVSLDMDGWANEEDLLTRALYDQITEAMATGVAAGEAFYKVPTGELASQAYIERAAAEHVGALVKGINNTTRDRLANSLQTSMKLGETLDEAQARVYNLVDDVSRAETIARTESVTSYQSGILEYGKSTGAESKTWQVAANPCEICAPLDGETVDIDDTFSSGDDAPPAHPNCLCGSILNYPDGSEEDSGD